MRILIFDIESSPLLGYAYGIYEQNIIKVVREPHLMSFAYKWYGEKKIHCHALPDYPLYKKEPYNDRELVKDLHALLDKADIVIAHNGNSFDIKVSNSRFLINKLDPISNYITIDTLREARKRFKFSSNKLTDLAMYAGVGSKIENKKDLWFNCLIGDMKSWGQMKKYNTHDVYLLEGIYEWMKPWIKHPNLNIFNGTVASCPKCLSTKIIHYGKRYSTSGIYQRYKCKMCGNDILGRENLLEKRPIVK